MAQSHRGDAAFCIGSGANERETDSLGACVERTLHVHFIDLRHADQRCAGKSLRCRDHRVQCVETDGPVLLIDDDAVRTSGRNRLGDDCRGDDAHMPIQQAARFGKLCLQRHLHGRSHLHRRGGLAANIRRRGAIAEPDWPL